MRWRSRTAGLLFLLALLAGCVGVRPRHAGDILPFPSLLDRPVAEIDLRDAYYGHVIMWIIGTTRDDKSVQSPNLIVLDGPRSGRGVTYRASNVTVGVVLSEVLRQTGLKHVFTNEALVVGTPESIERVCRRPALPRTHDAGIERKLEARLPVWDGCGCTIADVASFITWETSLRIDCRRGSHERLLFPGYVPDIRNMKVRNFLWWVAALTDHDLVFRERVLRFESKSSVVIRDFRCDTLTPTVVLSALHDAWRKSSTTGSAPPFFFVGATNMPWDTPGRIDIPECNLRTALGCVEEILPVQYVEYTNGIVFVQPRCYDAPICHKAFPFDFMRLDPSTSNAEVLVECRLSEFGIAFPRVGCYAKVWDDGRSLLVAHVTPELRKVEYLLQQMAKGILWDDIAIDPSVGCADVYYGYDGTGWREHRRKDGPVRP